MKNRILYQILIVLILTWLTHTSAFGTYTLIARWGTPGSEGSRLWDPSGVAIDSEGNVYMSEDNKYIYKLNSNGIFLTKWGTAGSGDGQFGIGSYLLGVAVDSIGNVYVADSNNNRIQKFDSNGVFLAKWGSGGSGDGQFSDPKGVAVDNEGNVYVADTGNSRIQKFDSNGTFLTKWGTRGHDGYGGQFINMYGIAVDDEGNVYVTDYSATSFAYSTTSIQKFDSNGVFLSKWGNYGSGNGQLYNPHGVATDSAGNVYVVDQGNHRIQKFDSSGEFLTKWGIYDVGEHDYQHSSPIGIALDSLGNVYVADHGSHYIHVFSDDGTPEPIEQPIPEPSTILLLTTGVVGMASYGFIRRRRL